MMFGTGESFRYIECNNCGCLQIEKIPKNIDQYYPENYYSYQEISNNGLIRSSLRKARDRSSVFGVGLLGKLLNKISGNALLSMLSNLNLTRNSRILDVGCGQGALVHSLREIGFINVLGIDPFNAHDISYKNGLSVLKKQLHEVDGVWDVIMFNHSFEHMPDPLNILNKVASMLDVGGCCIIRIPVVSSYAWKHYKENWVQIDAPRHFHLHSVESMRMLAEKADLRLSDDVIYDSSDFQFWGSYQYEKEVCLYCYNSYVVNPTKSMFSKSDIKAYKVRARTLNKENNGDQAIFFLNK